LFREWLADAERHEPSHPNACALATADAAGHPSARIVLLRGIDERGFSFFTNRESRKGRDLAENPRAALTFHWKSTRRQVRIEGVVEWVGDDESDRYFVTRPRSSQLASWASAQSATLPSRRALDEAVAREAERHTGGPVPRPPFWGGYRVVPERIEFWHEGEARLHRRWEYELRDGAWRSRALFP
jgi:pyridoxamine 5'-phosphate oxidase